MTALLPPPSSDIVWRQLRPRFWVGRADDRHLGTIERGRRFTVTDVDGDARGGYPTLQAAQAALTGEPQIVPAPAAGGRGAPPGGPPDRPRRGGEEPCRDAAAHGDDRRHGRLRGALDDRAHAPALSADQRAAYRPASAAPASARNRAGSAIAAPAPPARSASATASAQASIDAAMLPAT